MRVGHEEALGTLLASGSVIKVLFVRDSRSASRHHQGLDQGVLLLRSEQNRRLHMQVMDRLLQLQVRSFPLCDGGEDGGLKWRGLVLTEDGVTDLRLTIGESRFSKHGCRDVGHRRFIESVLSARTHHEDGLSCLSNRG